MRRTCSQVARCVSIAASPLLLLIATSIWNELLSDGFRILLSWIWKEKSNITIIQFEAHIGMTTTNRYNYNLGTCGSSNKQTNNTTNIWNNQADCTKLRIHTHYRNLHGQSTGMASERRTWVGVCVDFTACRLAVPLKTSCKSYKKTNGKSRVFIYTASVFGFSLLLDVDVFAHSNR